LRAAGTAASGNVVAGGRSGAGGELLACAIGLFAAEGYANVSVERIAAAAGLATGSFYKHFASKHDLLATAFNQAEALLQTEIEGALVDTTDPARALDRLLDQYLGMVATRPDLTTILINDNFELDEPNRVRAWRIYERLVDRWAVFVERAAECDPIEARVRTQAAFLLVHGLTLWLAWSRVAVAVAPSFVHALAAAAVKPA
jgi:AcrR family transcriptional regulator